MIFVSHPKCLNIALHLEQVTTIVLLRSFIFRSTLKMRLTQFQWAHTLVYIVSRWFFIIWLIWVARPYIPFTAFQYLHQVLMLLFNDFHANFQSMKDCITYLSIFYIKKLFPDFHCVKIFNYDIFVKKYDSSDLPFELPIKPP